MSEVLQKELSYEFKRLYPALIRFAQSLWGVVSRVDAEDLVQSSFNKVIHNLRAGKEFPEHLESYLRTVIKNIHTDQFRRQTKVNKNHKPNDPNNLEPKRYHLFKFTNFKEEDEILQPTEENPLFDPFLKDGLNEALKKTGEQCQELLRAIAEGYKYAEIADRQGMGTNTVASSVYRCRAKLLALLETEKELFEDILNKLFRNRG